MKKNRRTRYKGTLKIMCMYRNVREKLPELVKTITFAGVTVVLDRKRYAFYGRRWQTICTNASVRLTYAVLHNLFLQKTNFSSSILIPFKWTVTSGRCEKLPLFIADVVAPLSAIDEFIPSKMNKIKHLSPQQRLHAYTLSDMRNHFSASDFRLSKNNISRSFHLSKERTVFVTGIPFISMIIITVLCVLMVILDGVLFLYLPRTMKKEMLSFRKEGIRNLSTTKVSIDPTDPHTLNRPKGQ